MRALLVILALIAATAAYGQFNGCRPGFCNVTSGGVAPGGCNGAIDLSTGCPQPMLGVL